MTQPHVIRVPEGRLDEVKVIAVCSECHTPLEARHVAEDEHASERTELVCSDHGVRVTKWGI